MSEMEYGSDEHLDGLSRDALKAEVRWWHECALEMERENEKLRELVRGLRYCAKGAVGMCARVPVGGMRPFTCCPLYDFDGREYGCKKLMRELGMEAR